jgi:hypothetical protein
MNLEIRKPELVRRVNAHIQTGHYHDTDEVLEKPLMRLTRKRLCRCRPRNDGGRQAFRALGLKKITPARRGTAG